MASQSNRWGSSKSAPGFVERGKMLADGQKIGQRERTGKGNRVGPGKGGSMNGDAV